MHNHGPARTKLLALLLTMFAVTTPRAIAQSNAEQVLLQLANQTRAQHNLSPLRWDNALAIAARNHLRWVIRNSELLHQYPGEPDLVTRGANAGAHFSTISENIAGHGQNPAELHQTWMSSAPHRHNLLDPDLTVVGIAVVEYQGLLFAVEDFGKDVQPLTPEAVEHQVAKLLQAQGFPPAPSNQDARKTCTMPQGQQAGTPKLVIQWDGADISHLPDAVRQNLDKTRYKSAAVGACPGRQPGGQFTSYHIALLLY
jgi:hypothetical protein